MKPDDHVKAELADAHALRAMHEGTASTEQQQRAMRWILTHACDVGGMPYWPTDRDTAFACGRLFVGKQIGRLLTMDLSTLRRAADERPSNRVKPGSVGT